MLVVTRKKDERLVIGDDIEIQVLRIGRENVRLGIKAPSHVSIYRYEIYEAIKEKETKEKETKAAEPVEKQESAGAPGPHSPSGSEPRVSAAESGREASEMNASPKARAKTEDR